MHAGPIRIETKMSNPEFVASLPTSRAQALAEGSPIYLGAPCKHGHNSYRKTVNGSCAQCVSEASNKSKERYAKSPARAEVNKRWNQSERAKTAKDRWKERDPKWAWVVSAVGAARTRAKYEGLPFDLTNEYVASIMSDTCPVLGCPLSFGGTKRPVFNSASIDKITPSKGYVQGNVAVISRRANMIKSDATVQEIFAVARWLQSQEAV